MRLIPIPAIAFGLLLLPAGGARADDATKAIIDKAIKAHGGAEKIGKEKAAQTKSKGTLSLMGGLNFTEETTVQPDRLKSVLQLEAGGNTIQVTTVFDGKKAWASVNGQTQELEGKVLDEMKEASYMTRLARLAVLKDNEYELSPLGEVKVNGKPAVGIRVASKGHRDVNLYFDKESGLLAKLERQAVDAMTGEDVAEERIITEYQEIDGVKVPKKAVINRDGKKFIEAEVVEIKFRDKFDESEFAKP
jgi:hypothetical protein